MTHPHQITDAAAAHAFMFGGKARFTLRSQATGTRYTYRIAKAKDSDSMFFANLLTGSDNTSDYTYIGYSRGTGFASGAKGQPSHPAFKALAWAEAQLRVAGAMPAQLEFWHEGRCACCGRPLTDPVSIERGVGPECFKKGGY